MMQYKGKIKGFFCVRVSRVRWLLHKNIYLMLGIKNLMLSVVYRKMIISRVVWQEETNLFVLCLEKRF